MPAKRKLPPLPEPAAIEPPAEPAPPKPKRAKSTIPDLGLGRSVLKSTRDWWKTVWESPMSAAWIASDIPALRRLAALLEQAARGDTRGQLLSEIRQLEDRFGLSPLARLRLQWKIEEKPPLPVPVEPPAQREEDRWLRAVE